jgi:hypothetical protein
MASGKRIKCLTIVDDDCREGVDILVDQGISGHDVARRLSEIGRFRGLPRTIRTDQGREFTGNPRALVQIDQIRLTRTIPGLKSLTEDQIDD